MCQEIHIDKTEITLLPRVSLRLGLGYLLTNRDVGLMGAKGLEPGTQRSRTEKCQRSHSSQFVFHLLYA